ncbi:hypothetical protein DRO03_03560 [Methanosarcinales archaeon]|nr:MAG: hypothetical protein DRO03_03560 [Methanosarcinales archaeon]
MAVPVHPGSASGAYLAPPAPSIEAVGSSLVIPVMVIVTASAVRISDAFDGQVNELVNLFIIF